MTSDAKPEARSDAQPPKIFVRDLQDKQTFTSCFLAKDKTLLTGKNGKPYISLHIADATGAVDTRVWDNVDAISEAFQSGDVIRLKGQVQIFQNRKQVIVHRLERANPEDYDIKDLVGASRRTADDMMAELMQIAQNFEDAAIRQLVLDCLNDSDLRPRLLRAPAAKSIHHAFEGGLLEHVLSICGLMKAIHAHYKLQSVDLKLDYLLFGAIFHDIGKVWELDTEQGITYTDKGKLLGHMILAVELVEKKASRIFGFPEETKDHLKHIILSHHGRLEYGSPKVPMFLEAFLVAAVDDLDSKINTISTFIKSEREAGGDKWSRFNQLFERYFLLNV